MNCPKCSKDFEREHHRQKYCNECRGVKYVSITPLKAMKLEEAAITISNSFPKISEEPQSLGPLDVYSPKRWSSLLENGYEFDPELGRARCKEMTSNVALPSPGDPAYVETPVGEDMLTFNDLPVSDRFIIERESNPNEPDRTREVMIEIALSYHRLFGKAHAHEFGGK